MILPQIATTANGPAISHSSDFSLVSASKPAAAGEILSLFATGLGPVRGVVTGQPFPSNPPALARIPIERWLPNQRRARSRICAPIPDRSTLKRVMDLAKL